MSPAPLKRMLIASLLVLPLLSHCGSKTGGAAGSGVGLHALVISGRSLEYLKLPTTGVWTFITVDSSRGEDQGALAVDSSGFAYVSYGSTDPSAYYGVRYATNGSGTFLNESIVLSVATGNNDQSGIAVGTNGVIHIIHNDYSGSAFSAVEHFGTSGSWSLGGTVLTDVVTSVPFAFFNAMPGPASKIITQATPIRSGSVLRLNNKDSAWGSVIGISDVGGTACVAAAHNGSIDMDSRGVGHVAYICNANGGITHLAYATNLSGGWVTSSVVFGTTGADTPYGVHLYIDNNDVLHLLYNQQGLKYATNSGSGWSAPQSLTTSGSALGSSNLTASDISNVHILYVGDTTLYYLTNTSGSWVQSVAKVYDTTPAIQEGFWNGL